ncbi:dipeptidyl peptidase III [Annulohypoxylon nitens]|nr:dipeptidyl peptidase III [Annulohypoxylon nitens]
MIASKNLETRDVVYRLGIREVFDNLGDNNGHSKLYAHHLARACWHGSRIMLRQTSPESEGIFNFILELHKACGGKWNQFCNSGISQEYLDAWLEFCGMFLSSLGNYSDDGDRKVIPKIPEEALCKMASVSDEALSILKDILEPMMASKPASLGFPDANNQSSYYLGNERITREEVKSLTRVMEEIKISPLNTRLEKQVSRSNSFDDDFTIVQASVEMDNVPKHLRDMMLGNRRRVRLYVRRGDHSEEMSKICVELAEALKYATNKEQKIALSHRINSFRTGNYSTFGSAQMAWVKDKYPRVEHCMGFLFGYRDPCGLRAEWQAAVGIAHPEETKKMSRLVGRFSELICTLPWAVPDENNGKGPFEPNEPSIPDFTIIHVLASVSSTIWEATNITLSDRRGKTIGAKNIVYGNRMNLNRSPDRPCYYVHPSETKAFQGYSHILRFISTAIHELIGHGTGKFLTETASGKSNFNKENPPISPLTGEPIRTWYKPRETWNGVFGKLAPTVEECRAFLVSYYLTDNKIILDLFGYSQSSTMTADDFIYYTYLQIGVDGLRALHSFRIEDQTWGGDHGQAQFAILKYLLENGNGVMYIEHDTASETLFVRLERSKIISNGKSSIGNMLCNIHIWRSTADINACRPFYEALSVVDGKYEQWRQIVVSKPEPKWKFVQPNTFLKDDGTVELREYEASNVGIIQSFFERNV